MTTKVEQFNRTSENRIVEIMVVFVLIKEFHTSEYGAMLGDENQSSSARGFHHYVILERLVYIGLLQHTSIQRG